MQSTIAILLRAGILLGCLAALPLMAAGGVGSVDKLLAEANGWWQRHQHAGPLNAPRTIQVELPADALQYRDFTPLSDIHSSDPSQRSQQNLPPDLPHQFVERDHQQSREMNPNRSGSPANFSRPDIQLVSNTVGQSQSNQTFPPRAETLDHTMEERFPPQAEERHANAGQIDQVLRDWGAVDLKLEPWGSSGNLYRYHAQMAIGGLGDVHRHFQAVHTDPEQAAQEVLRQVRSWLRR